ncbi:MAG: DNA polymerase III subunit alpha [Candidatus Desulfovibrio kirbyi]|uniref:DNA polymerase III subunit alpha n=1 Tax=Candidatus Desulfovibrio kirbyi TaxID=2696086 RepID=A0A6L2R4P9_9BACT|nr:MAG: DNA polymerase III subunit alpha [Candidatus Desulfovibrio kirbyi]
MSDFVHLHCHTEYSLLDGSIRIRDLCDCAKNFGMPACAITDHGNLFGAARFYFACKDVGIKPIIGCEVYVCRDHTDKSRTLDAVRNSYHLILLAQNAAGYRNLVKLVTKSFLDGFYYTPRVDKALLRAHAEGLVCLSACMAGEIPSALSASDADGALRLTREYAAIYPDRFYLELQANGLVEQEKINAGLQELAATAGLPLVATNDCHYLTAQDVEAHDVLLCIQTAAKVDDKDRMRFETRELYYKSAEEMERAFAHVPEALANTVRIADSCDFTMDYGKHYFPVYALPEGADMGGELRRLAEEGLEKRLAKHPDRDTLNRDMYQERLGHELDVILNMGFPGYLLIVQEFIRWAKDNAIPVGPGRGSVAGSLVAWALGITDLDPLPYGLLFERFLNSERVSLPDIDVDFCERRRGEVIRHMVERYGEMAVAQITTFGTMKARAVVRDVARALGISIAETNRIAKLIPDDLKMTLKKALDQEPELRKLCESDDPRVQKLVDISLRLEGLVRHKSVHAAGLVVSDGSMDDYLPLYNGKNPDEPPVTQFDGPMVEKIGLVKFDFLGLKTMTVIADTLENIKRQGKTPLVLEELPLTDQATYELYGRGDTDGVFQMESAGLRKYLRMLKPSCFEDIIAMLALYRPGPLGSGMVDSFIRRKHGQERVAYPHESLADCLRDTYGVILYQEQVMQIARVIADYTLGGADLLRRAMGKKKTEEMARERAKFVAGAGKKSIDTDTANEIFDLMEKFADYGFNKSHSAAYALISYHTAYLKAHYKVEFMAALLTSEIGNNQDKLLKYITCCKAMGINVCPPSVNRSRSDFVAAEDSVVFGLGGIKNVGEAAVDDIVKSRDNDGEFASFLDFCCRVNLRRVTNRVLEFLIKGGACDCFGVSRAGLLAVMDTVAARAQKLLKDKKSKQASLVAMTASAETPAQSGIGFDCSEAGIPEMNDTDMLKAEKEALGAYFTNHPLHAYAHEKQRLGLTTLEETLDMLTGAEISCAVMVVDVKKVTAKAGRYAGKYMAFVQVEDLTCRAEVVFWSEVYDKVKELLVVDNTLCLTAKLEENSVEGQSDETGEAGVPTIKLLARHAQDLRQFCEQSANPVWVDIPAHRLGREDMLALKNILETYPGTVAAKGRVVLDGITCRLCFADSLKVRPGLDLNNALYQWTV